MSFKDPLLLLLVLLIPLGVFAQRRLAERRKRYAVRFPALSTIAGLMTPVPTWRRRLPPALLALAVLALAVGAARPQHEVNVAVEQASVMLVLDASGSMQAEDVRPTRLDAAISAADRFLDTVPSGTKVGLVAFSTAPYTAAAPTTDRDTVREAIDSLVPDGGTATGDALIAALQALGRNPEAPPSAADATKPPAAIILLSDGKAQGGVDAVEVARASGRLDVPIYTVALGTDEGVVPGPYGEEIPVPPDPESLRREAQVSGGEFFAVDDAERLSTVYESLGSQLGSRPRERELTALFAGLGLLLLAGGAGLAVRWRGRVA